MDFFPLLHQVLLVVVVVVAAAAAGRALGILESCPVSTVWHGNRQVFRCLPPPALLGFIAGQALCV